MAPASADRRPDPSPDCDLYSFSEQGPFLVDPDDLPWRIDVTKLREHSRALVPELLRRRRLPPTRRIVRVSHVLGTAFAGWYLFDRPKGRPESRLGLSRRLRLGFQRLGPTYIKLGQILSS
ncbi:MAG: ABC1 kinase family protein, partial [Acidimicrobiales bacterium]